MERTKTHDYLNDDGHALLALCSNLALREGEEPFKLSEWNQLARQIQGSSLKQPAALQGRAADELARELGIPPEDGGRIVRLLDRSSRLALELESLFARGLWVVTRMDDHYPARLRDTLKHQAPTVLFGAGDISRLRHAGVAVIGSRNIDEAGAAFARELGRKAVAAGLAVVSGGARGTDRLAMEGALESSGHAVGVLADSLERTVRQADLRQLLLDGQLVLVTPYAPTAGFSVGAAMGRNKVIYGLADFAVVVSSDFQTGGTWAGAMEALKAGWCPTFARDGAGAPKGNTGLIKAEQRRCRKVNWDQSVIWRCGCANMEKLRLPRRTCSEWPCARNPEAHADCIASAKPPVISRKCQAHSPRGVRVRRKAC